MQQYIAFEVMEGAYDISCPDPACPSQGVLDTTQMEALTDKQDSSHTSLPVLFYLSQFCIHPTLDLQIVLRAKYVM